MPKTSLWEEHLKCRKGLLAGLPSAGPEEQWLSRQLDEHLIWLLAERDPAFLAWWMWAAKAAWEWAAHERKKMRSDEEGMRSVEEYISRIRPPRRLSGYRLFPKKRPHPIRVAGQFEQVAGALRRYWKRGRCVAGVHVLLSVPLPKIYRELGVPDAFQPSKADVEKWHNHSSAETFAYRLLSHIHRRQPSYIRRLVSEGRPFQGLIIGRRLRAHETPVKSKK